MYTSLQYSDIFTGYLSEPEFPKRLHASVSTPSPPPPLLISLTFYLCTPLLDLFTPVPTPASSKFHSISARQKGDRAFWSFCHCTLEKLQLSTPLSLLWTHVSSTSQNLISSYLTDLLCVRCVWCGVCVCGWEGEKEKERECVQQMWLCVDVLMYD